MLKANIGLSKKFTHECHSRGYAIHLEGEIPFSINDPQAVLEKIQELFSVAHEALELEVESDQRKKNYKSNLRLRED